MKHNTKLTDFKFRKFISFLFDYFSFFISSHSSSSSLLLFNENFDFDRSCFLEDESKSSCLSLLYFKVIYFYGYLNKESESDLFSFIYLFAKEESRLDIRNFIYFFN